MPQENNMAELLRLMHTMIVKVDDLAADMKNVKSDVRDLKSDVQGLKSDVQELKTTTVRVEKKLDVLSGQFQDVGGQAIKDTQRITILQGRVDILESKAN